MDGAGFTVRPLTLSLALVAAGFALMLWAGYAEPQEVERPNIVYILTDDNSRAVLEKAMPITERRIGGEGMVFENATFAQPLCCPNRASMQRGQYPHNTGVLDNEPPGGGFETFRARGLHNDTYATRIDQAGYRTGHFGKYMNGHENFLNMRIPGWDTFKGGAPMAKCYSSNGEKKCPPEYEAMRHDAWVNKQAIPWIRNAAAGEAPYLAVASYYNPHRPCEHPDSYDRRFTDATHRPPSYNEADVGDKPEAVRSKPRFDAETHQAIQREHRCRLRAAAFTDQLIGRLLDTIEATGEADNTFVVFWSDNGYKEGEHRLWTKGSPYVEDSHFPLMLRGPGVAPDSTSEELINTVDLRHTFEDMANASSPDYGDGTSWLPLALGEPTPWRTFAYSEAIGDFSGQGAPKWRATYSRSYAYHEWETGETESYDLTFDPYELDGTTSPDERGSEALAKAALEKYRGCASQTCRVAGF